MTSYCPWEPRIGYAWLSDIWQRGSSASVNGIGSQGRARVGYGFGSFNGFAYGMASRF